MLAQLTLEDSRCPITLASISEIEEADRPRIILWQSQGVWGFCASLNDYIQGVLISGGCHSTNRQAIQSLYTCDGPIEFKFDADNTPVDQDSNGALGIDLTLPGGVERKYLWTSETHLIFGSRRTFLRCDVIMSQLGPGDNLVGEMNVKVNEGDSEYQFWYSGELNSCLLPNGQGGIRNGNCDFHGRWVNGIPTSPISLHVTDSDQRFTLHFSVDGTLSQVLTPDGAPYTGELSFRMNRVFFTGPIVAGIPTGDISIGYPNGECYRGGYRDGRLEGHGTLTRADGTAIRSLFRVGLPTGRTTYITRTHELVGQFEGFTPNGVGCKTVLVGDDAGWQYIGHFNHRWEFTGFVYNQENVFSGAYINNGTVRFPNDREIALSNQGVLLPGIMRWTMAQNAYNDAVRQLELGE
ncbi:MAG: hypothetical protein O3A01_04555 [bacterium]|nr:hypothetical protein [bacterium]